MVSPIITSLSGSGVTDPMGCGCGCREPVSSSSGLWDPPSKSLVYGLETGASRLASQVLLSLGAGGPRLQWSPMPWHGCGWGYGEAIPRSPGFQWLEVGHGWSSRVYDLGSRAF